MAFNFDHRVSGPFSSCGKPLDKRESCSTTVCTKMRSRTRSYGSRDFLSGRIFRLWSPFSRNRATDGSTVYTRPTFLFIKGVYLGLRLLPLKLCKTISGWGVYTIENNFDHLLVRWNTCTVCRSKSCAIPQFPCKRKADLCEFFSVLAFVWIRVNVVI